MIDIKLYKFKCFLKEKNINIDITEEELKLLSEDLFDRITKIVETKDIVSLLIDEIIKLRTKVKTIQENTLKNEWEEETFPHLYKIPQRKYNA